MILLADTNAVQETVKEISNFQKFIEKSGPSVIAFGIRVLLALLAFFVGHQLIKWVRRLVRASMERANSDTGARQFVDSLLKFGLHILLIMFIANQLGVESTSTAALIASGGVAVSLALQGSLSNLAGGVLILLLKPFVVGDYIMEDAHGNEGTVKEIQIFYTKLATLDNKTIVIPNGTLANTSLTNVTDKDYRQLDLKIDISYDADLKKAKRLLEGILLEDSCVIQEMAHNVFVDNLGESSVVLGVRAWVRTEEYWPTRWRMLETIKLTMDENEIEIPFKQLKIHVGNI
ncbi:mechanosensitive ion channel family protein [Bariatricus massiliensis]|uniref:Mechanosensitive ion channel family protein n=1 Tax=Bariatricus massiliensis TaxID=1745713 RepID=A0ABS8DCF8_9FIRM|nr:mechanosensitive ion channel family protein [Bariatricus massiliensis]MCB7303298.1 mechanosensitive ion channel family protein [Bariatricus massiliensis]MCB7373430.1 mechanosensitive ion channel family protein [Bariatricus massiliensis]MCB7386100.1 mechanosensitive ion channel family protein [Bariatricus massiliensis]MCB7410262.1 mechanosensitive ion channel family protein [Bariatricus massiliensis]MCQ5252454.1 mechanosensitive ion channel family protein [Bariatricus massiliensis]